MRDPARIFGEIRALTADILGDDLVGIYVHGSLAFGCFTWEKSDIDYLAVIRAPMTQTQKVEYIRRLAALNEKAPPKGIEMSIVLAEHCRHFVYPTPYELHFSAAYLDGIRADLEGYCRRMHGTDPDLAAHFTVIRAVGITLCGVPAERMFAAVPAADHLASLRCDAENAGEAILQNPVYVILNLCRILAYIRKGSVLSKAQGGAWGLAHLPAQFHGILAAALDDYSAKRIFAADTHREVLTEFAQYMSEQIFADEKP